ncbi:MAG: ABC transporter permease [Alphaproteobacteria bacterium]
MSPGAAALGELARRFVRNRSALVGLGILAAVLLLAAAAPLIFPGTPFALAGKPLSPPFGAFLLGTDTLGRDVAAGIAHGARTSLMIGIVSTAVAVAFGTLAGGLAGFYGGRIDALLMRVTEIFQTIPSFIFAIVLVAVMSPSVASTVIAIAIVSWPGVARLARGEFMSMRQREYVQSCISLGMGDARIMFAQILPNCLSPLIVTASLLVATAILIESGLAFLGLGDPNVMSWGFQVGAGRTVLRIAWWICTFPGIAILLTVLAINLVGEGLNDALNPRLRRR